MTAFHERSAMAAFHQQLAADRAANQTLLQWIAAGTRCLDEHGRDNTAHRQKDARRRLADCEALLAQI